jgi:hypothetical protein
MVEFRGAFRSMTAPTHELELEKLIISKRLAHSVDR